MNLGYKYYPDCYNKNYSYWFFNGGYYRHYPNLYRQFGNYYRSNIGEHRVMGSVNHGFMAVADSHFNLNGGNRLNPLTSPSSYQRPSGQSYQKNSESIIHSNANSYHSQSWGSFGGRGNFIGGGFHGGGRR